MLRRRNYRPKIFLYHAKHGFGALRQGLALAHSTLTQCSVLVLSRNVPRLSLLKRVMISVIGRSRATLGSKALTQKARVWRVQHESAILSLSATPRGLRLQHSLAQCSACFSAPKQCPAVAPRAVAECSALGRSRAKIGARGPTLGPPYRFSRKKTQSSGSAVCYAVFGYSALSCNASLRCRVPKRMPLGLAISRSLSLQHDLAQRSAFATKTREKKQ